MFLSKDTISKIKRNISHNNGKDKKTKGIQGTLTFDDFMEKIKDQNWKCYICKQEFKFNGEQWCYFFPSADRINNNKIHTKDNVAISCFFCNVRKFKGIHEKICGLCKDEEHRYNGEIITKSGLFRSLYNSEYELKKYLLNMKNELSHEALRTPPNNSTECPTYVSTKSELVLMQTTFNS